MEAHQEAVSERSRRSVLVIVGMVVCLALPLALTLTTVRVPAWQAQGVDDPTPFGYTVSLLLFLVPVVAIGGWHLRGKRGFDQRAFLWSAGMIAGLGSLLDVAFGHAFFAFPNQGATLGLRLPAWDWSRMTFVGGYLPVEEFGFYILGGIFMAATYLWAAEYWVPDRQRDDYHEAARAHPRIIRIGWWALGLWLLALGGGLAFRALRSGGFAGYYTFVMVGGALPTVLLGRTVREFVNWHALAFAFGALLLVSVIWEASLGVPYGWWAYRPGQMMGIYIRGWANLPIEAVLVWILGVWTAVHIYEFFRIFLRMDDRKVRHRLFGQRSEGGGAGG